MKRTCRACRCSWTADVDYCPECDISQTFSVHMDAVTVKGALAALLAIERADMAALDEDTHRALGAVVLPLRKAMDDYIERTRVL